jgi:hypothetical protein
VHALILAALFSAQPVDETVVVVNIAALSLKDAERLDGKRVVTTFRVGATPYTWGGRQPCNCHRAQVRRE